jgi:hypothetical protein
MTMDAAIRREKQTPLLLSELTVTWVPAFAGMT